MYPKNAQEVAAIVEALGETNETFAIKSGGHNPNLYFASIDGGPLISTGSLNQVELDTATETAKLGPGNRWDEVANKLDGSGYSIVGGRLGNVGVGGYMLGGEFIWGEFIQPLMGDVLLILMEIKSRRPQLHVDRIRLGSKLGRVL